MPTKIGCVSLGCPKNLIDSEIMLGLLDRDAYQITTSLNEAEVIIVNTCAFIEDAREEAVDSILEAALYKKTGKLKALIVTGCLAQRYQDEIIKEMPEVDAVLGTGNISEIQKAIEESLGRKKGKRLYIGDPSDVDYLDNLRIVSAKGASQYLKIAEGCSNLCTYCIIPSLRGPFRSRTIESIEKEAGFLAEQGAKELIIVAQDVSRYGEDRYGRPAMVELIRRLSGIGSIEWIRLLYCYPERITDGLIAEMKENPKLVNYLDIPVQHASDRILKAMGRKSRQKDLIELIRRLRTEIPDIILRTSLITGFPGETEDDFGILKDFIRENPFDRLGVFAYSKEEGTPASMMKDQIDEETKQRRRDEILSIQQCIAPEGMKKRIGKVYQVLVEGVADDGVFYYGRSYAETPEIDPVIYFTSEEPLEFGTFVNVKILNTEQLDLVGHVTHNVCNSGTEV